MTRQVRFYRQTPEGKQAVKPEEIQGLVSNTPKESYAQILSAQGITYEVVEAGAQRPPTTQELPQIWSVLEKLGTQQQPKPTTPTKKTTPPVDIEMTKAGPRTLREETPKPEAPKTKTPTKKTTPSEDPFGDALENLDLREEETPKPEAPKTKTPTKTQAPATAKTTTPKKPQTTHGIIIKDTATLERELQEELDATPPIREIEGRNPEARKLEERARKLEIRAKNPGVVDYILSMRNTIPFDMDLQSWLIRYEMSTTYLNAAKLYENSGEYEKAAQIMEKNAQGIINYKKFGRKSSYDFGKANILQFIARIERNYEKTGTPEETTHAVMRLAGTFHPAYKQAFTWLGEQAEWRGDVQGAIDKYTLAGAVRVTNTSVFDIDEERLYTILEVSQRNLDDKAKIKLEALRQKREWEKQEYCRLRTSYGQGILASYEEAVAQNVKDIHISRWRSEEQHKRYMEERARWEEEQRAEERRRKEDEERYYEQQRHEPD